MPSPIRRYAFRRNLPHLQSDAPLFVSLSTYKRWELPPSARDTVFATVLREHKRKVWVYAFVVMPDHLHMLFFPLRDASGARFSIAEIMSGIKGPSAHGVNRSLARHGRVWEEEYFDHWLRKNESIDAKVAYIAENPEIAGLVESYLDYPWLWINPEHVD